MRRYPARPIVGVGALIFSGEQVLLVQRGKEPLKGYWSLPGGAVEAGEPLAEALRREVREETGLSVAISRLGEIFERILRDGDGMVEYHYVLIDYVCEVLGGELQAGDDSAAVGWFGPEELKGLQITSGTIEVIERCRTGAKNF